MPLPWRYILVSLLIGLFLGAAGGLWSAQAFRPKWMRPSPERMVRRFDRALQLSDSQKTQIHTIVNTHREKIRSQRQEARQALQMEIRKVLTPEQQAKFEEMERKREARRK